MIQRPSATEQIAALEEERRQARLLAAFFDAAVRSQDNEQAVCQALAERATEAVGDACVVWLLSDDREWLEPVGVQATDPERTEAVRSAMPRRRVDEGYYADVIQSGRPLFLPTFDPGEPGALAGSLNAEQRDRLRQFGTRALIAVALTIGDRVGGVLASGRIDKPDPYTESDLQLLQALASRASLVLDNARTHRALKDSAARLERIISGSPIATIVLDPDSTVRMWSRSAEGLLGWTSEEVIGRPLPAIMGDDPEQQDRALRGEGAQGLVAHARHRDGHEIAAALFAARLGEGSGSTGVVLRLVDLSERQRLEAQLMQAQRLESVGRLAGGIAHDFNNILTAILGFSRMAQDDLPADAPQQESIRAIEESADRAAMLVRQLLAFGRQQVLRPQVLDLGHVVSGLIPMLGRLIGEDVVLSAQPAAGLHPIEADRGQLEQVIVNLVVNARDAMPRGGRLMIETQNVDLDAAYAETHPEVTPGAHVMLAVSDTGTGMDPETLAHIFEPFFTTKEAARGTGLGLATAYGIVKQSGGHIWVYSEAGRGTTFRLYFPVTQAAAAVTPDPSQPPLPVTGDETILVAEDEEILRSLIQIVLGRLGYTVLLAPDGASALEVVRQQRIDLLVTDVVMPGQSGFDLAAAVRSMDPRVGVLFMSGYTAAALESHGPAVRGELLLQKPFTPGTLGEAVRAALEARG
jgi:two-component system cell cycle sensor histidine kinase/response regulator CckA